MSFPLRRSLRRWGYQLGLVAGVAFVAWYLVSNTVHNLESGRLYKLSLSVGGARCEAGSSETLDALITRADAAISSGR